MQKRRILVVDDEEDLCEILKFNLENEGYEVKTASSGEQALDLISNAFDLVLLDVMMYGLSGFNTAEKIRNEKNLTVPIIFLTAKNAEDDILTGFSMGADDYISKPFSIKEVLARINSVLKRSNLKKQNELGENGIFLDMAKKEAFLDGKAIGATKREFELLCLFVKNPDRVFSREELLSKVWPDDGCVLVRTVDVHIARLRKKLKKYGDLIKSRSGYGYYMNYEETKL